MFPIDESVLNTSLANRKISEHVHSFVEIGGGGFNRTLPSSNSHSGFKSELIYSILEGNGTDLIVRG